MCAWIHPLVYTNLILQWITPKKKVYFFTKGIGLNSKNDFMILIGFNSKNDFILLNTCMQYILQSVGNDDIYK